MNRTEPSLSTSLQGKQGVQGATHLVPTVKMRFEKVRYSRTTPNSRLYTLLSLH